MKAGGYWGRGLTGRSARIFGTVLLIAAFGYLFAKLAAIDPEALGKIDWSEASFAVAAGTIVYTFAGLTLAITWAWLLRCCKGSRVGFGTAVEVYAVTQAFKYVPGNVMHLLVRQGVAARLRVGQAAMATTGVIEIASLLALSTALAAVTLGPSILASQLSIRFGSATILAILAVGAGFAAILGVAIRRWTDWRTLVMGGWLAALGHLVFFALAGVVVFLVTHTATTDGGLELFQAIGVMGLAWIAGFVVLGAPAGLGVREAALIALLEPSVGLDAAAMSALLVRVTTVSGDGLLALAALALRPCARVLFSGASPRKSTEPVYRRIE